MKKILALLLAMAILLSLAACSSDGSGEQATDPSATDAPTDPTGGNGGNGGNGDNGGSENGGSETDTATPVKFSKTEFAEKLVDYTNNTISDESQYVETEKDEESMENENGYQRDKWYITDFSEEHNLNLLLHTTQAANPKTNEWISIERQDNPYTNDIIYFVDINYDVACETEEAAMAQAKLDAYCLPSFFEIDFANVQFTLVSPDPTKVKVVNTLTTAQLQMLVNGDYLYISASRYNTKRDGFTATINVSIQEAADGQFLCHTEFSLRYSC